MLRLRPYKKCDAAYVVSWLGDEEIFWKWCAGVFGHFPISADALNEYYDKFADSDHFFEWTAFDADGPAGHMIMRFLNEEKSVLRFGLIVVDHTRRGRGYGKEMLLLALRYAFDILKTQKVSVGVFDNNPAAHHCYTSIGFHETEEQEIYHLMGENWRYRILEMNQSDFTHQERILSGLNFR